MSLLRQGGFGTTPESKVVSLCLGKVSLLEVYLPRRFDLFSRGNPDLCTQVGLRVSVLSGEGTKAYVVEIGITEVGNE